MQALRSSKPQATHVLQRLLASPNLIATIQALPAERLGAIVHEIGLEDASEIVALATTEQLVDLFDDDLWKSGDDVSERFDAERFVLWLEVLFEAGEELVVDRLTQLPRELLCVAVSTLAYVLDLDVLLTDSERDERYLSRLERAIESSASEEWEEFRLMDRGARGFDVLIAALFALDTAHHDVLRAVLERCCDLTFQEVEERGGLIKALGRLEAAEESLRHERQERRTARGFVSLADARAFLRIVLRDLRYDLGRDPITHAYFRDVYGKQRANGALREVRARPAAYSVVDVLGGDISPEPVAKLQPLLGAALGVLRQSHPDVCELRLAELAYLTNVLIAVSHAQPRRLRPIEASELVVRVSVAGLEVMGLNTSKVELLAESLQTVLLDVAFRLGWLEVANREDEPLVALLRQVSRLPALEEESP